MSRSIVLDRDFMERVKLDKHTRGYPFVTISRQAGAGGHTLAETLRKRTAERRYEDLYRGWKVYDEAICNAVIQDPDLHVSIQELLTEDYNNPVVDFLHEMVGKQTSHFIVSKKVFRFVKAVAAFGKVVIVGRAGCCVTDQIPGGIHVRLVASEETRRRRMAERFGVSDHDARRMMEKQDHDRARLLRDFFDRDIEDPTLYNATWDTDIHTIDSIASQIMTLIAEKAHEIGRA